MILTPLPPYNKEYQKHFEPVFSWFKTIFKKDLKVLSDSTSFSVNDLEMKVISLIGFLINLGSLPPLLTSVWEAQPLVF